MLWTGGILTIGCTLFFCGHQEDKTSKTLGQIKDVNRTDTIKPSRYTNTWRISQEYVWRGFGVYQWGKKREQATPRFLLPTFIHKFIYHPPTIHSRFTIYCQETKMKRSAFTKSWACLFGLLLFSTKVNHERQKTWSTRPLFMCLH